MSYHGLEMIKLGVGVVLVAVVASACSSTTYVNNFVVDADASAPGDDAPADGQAVDSPDDGDDTAIDASGPSTDADADVVPDGGADASTCVLDTTPTATSDDCYPEASCGFCGNVGFRYRCGQSTSMRPANVDCTKLDDGSSCCRAECTRRTSLSSSQCPDYPFTVAWSCPYDPNISNEDFPQFSGCTRNSKFPGKVSLTYCCDTMVEPEWPLY